MATHDYNLANQDGASFRSDLNNALAAIVSNNSSSTAPATTFAHQIWVDTTANVIKQRNAANDAWVELWRIDGGFNAKTFSSNVTLNAQSDLRFADSDSSNWVAFQAPATVSSNVTWTLPSADGTSGQVIETNGSGVLSWADAGGVTDNITEGNTSAEVVDTGSDGHFKVVTEGTEALRVTNAQRVGIGTASPNTILEASTSVNTGGAIRITNPNTGTSANSAFVAHNGTFDCSFGIGGTNYTTYAAVRPNAAFVYCNQANGIGLTADNASGFINFVTGGSTERARIDSSGRLLVGQTTQSNSSLLTIKGNSGNSAGAGEITLQRGEAATSISSGESLGQIYFTDNSSNKFAEISAWADGNASSSDYPGRLAFYTTKDGTSTLSERVRIDNFGAFKASNVQSGTTYLNVAQTFHEIRTDDTDQWIAVLSHATGGNPYGLNIYYEFANPNNTTRQFIYCNDSLALRFEVRSNGGVANYSSNNANLCDEREKKNIESLDSTWDCLKHWDLKKFHYNEDADTDDKRYGVIAQQVAPHCPEVITDWVKQKAADAVLDDDGNVVTEAKEEIVRMGVKEQQMYWMAIKALQEAQTRIETLETANASLEARLTALENA